jgi:hypothetical protein
MSSIFIGTGEQKQSLLLRRANRHGLIAGATGTGKTVTLQILAEGFADQGVPVFMADVKGDLSGMSQAGSERHKLHEKLLKRAAKIGFDDYAYRPYSTVFWDLYGDQGHAIRTTVSEMGPLLLSRLLELNDTQEGVVNIAFRVADDAGLLLLDFKDLRAILNHVSENRKEISSTLGNVSPASIGAIQRRLLVLENQGGDEFFGEPALDIRDFMAVDENGRGRINILAADKLMQSPRLYATFLLWLLAELFEELPEIGDPDKPKLVFFFDEAHLLFDDAPKALMDKVEQVVRLIRSKGVGVFFVTQNPLDIPDDVAGQLGSRVQHALRAFTPRDQKAVKAAASTFRQNPNIDTAQAITQLGVGEALVSTLDEDGAPGIVDRCLIRPPSSRLGPATKGERLDVIEDSPVGDLYAHQIDRESAYEVLAARAEQKAASAAQEDTKTSQKKATKKRSNRQSVGEAALKSIVRSVSSRLGREIVRGILGAFKR